PGGSRPRLAAADLRRPLLPRACRVPDRLQSRAGRRRGLPGLPGASAGTAGEVADGGAGGCDRARAGGPGRARPVRAPARGARPRGRRGAREPFDLEQDARVGRGRGMARARAGLMHYKRVIPCMDVDGGRVVKGTRFIDNRDAGDPVELAAFYDREGADELIFLDITATSDKRDTVVELARRAADEVFVPFTIGGGVRE